MSDIRKGDKVRLTRPVIEGVVADVDRSGVRIGGTWYNEDDFNIEVIERRKPQVGDRIQGKELDALPVGTVIVADNEKPLMKHDDNMWHSAISGKHRSTGLTWPRKIIHLGS